MRAYLDALEVQGSRRSRKTPEQLGAELEQVEQRLRQAKGFDKLDLMARRIKINEELDLEASALNLQDLRRNFIAHAAQYARRKGIPAQAFRDAGVPPEDVAEAAIP